MKNSSLTRLGPGLAALALAGVACGGGIDNPSGGGPDAAIDATSDEWDQRLEEREVDYNAALRAAALRLVGRLPTLEEIRSIQNAGDLAAQKVAYEAHIDAFLASPDFARQIYFWWQDTLRMGDDTELDSAAAFAAQVTVEGRSYLELLTATAGQCGAFDVGAAAFTAADCGNGVPVQAGLLTHPGVHRHFTSNFSFRRVKWVQETFACTKFPAEIAATGIDIGAAAPYTGLFPFESVPALDTGRVNFRDTSAVICANCHTTMNHIAPLLATFDEQGQFQGQIVAPTPLEGAPPAELRDYLVAGETTAWRYGVPAADLPQLGAAMAADPDIAECAIARVWNWAMGKGDVVDALREVPAEIIRQEIDDFVADGHRLKSAIRGVFTHDDFVKF
ncbi:MAG: DUF1549 domain-containing protein [Kofleriaceae bacterium]|nr:DUF1549 domain-containing protein [Kofleriaceae bacterium]MBP6837448.1 DUF1549 domain-containing protein [Kofleriaceae bacterium]